MEAVLEAAVEARLRALLAHVLEANQQFNLTSVRDPKLAWSKHIVDSLHGLETGLFEARKSVFDLGAGAGFPGLPLAIARPVFPLTCIESTRKKADFLRATMEKFAIEGRVLSERAEALGQNVIWRERFDIGVCRAVGSISEVCELGLPLLRVGGHFVLWRGQNAHEELKIAQKALGKLGARAVQVLAYQLPDHAGDYHLVKLEKFQSTPRQYPRRDGMPKQQPL